VISYLKTLTTIGLGYIVFVAMDILWIGFIMNAAYLHYLGSILRMRNGVFSPHIPAALLTWAFIVVGSYLFVLPKIHGATVLVKFFWGAVYGLVLYGLYDFTNYAILASYPLAITLIDLAWGMFANGILAICLEYFNRLLMHK